MAIREGRWDCPTCGTCENRGGDVRCPGCGDPRPEGVRFYLPADEGAVSDAGALARARAGADWICEHCSASVRAAEGRCPGCGAERGASRSQRTRDYGMDDVPRAGRERRAAPPPPRPAKRRPGLALGPVLLLAFLAALVWWNRPREVSATVEGKSWARTVEVEHYRTVREEDWALPAGGRQLRSFRAVREHRRVLERYETRTRQVSEQVQVGTRTYTCGQRDLGNGYFQDVTCTEPRYETRTRSERYEEPVYRREPVYATRYAYEIERWLPHDTLRASGDASAEPVWPEVRAGPRVREGARTETYTVRFVDGRGRVYPRETGPDEYGRYAPGDAARLRVRRGGRAVEVVGR